MLNASFNTKELGYITILDLAWPQRMLCLVEADTKDYFVEAGTQDYYVWCDCEDDAATSVAVYRDEEGDGYEDEDGEWRSLQDDYVVYVVDDERRSVVAEVTDAWLAAL